MRRTIAVALTGLAIAATAPQVAVARDSAATSLPRLERHDGRFSLIVDGEPYFILAAQLHNSNAWPDMLDASWKSVEALAANTVEAPVYWEQFEPEQGRFDTENVDALIAKARATDKRLVLLWFGTWKNGQMQYAPEWVKRDPATYPRQLDAHGQPLDNLSTFAPANLKADRRAFTALMAHLKEVDGNRHTVILVQVENEPGTFGAVRDHSPAANAAFAAPVPEGILKSVHRSSGSWQDVFGPDADEMFNAWANARYIGAVAQAGKRVYPLPMYVNCWLRYKDKKYPGMDYPSGGPTYNVFDIWRAASPAIDFIGTDLYTTNATEFRKVLDQYHRPDNPAWVSETGFEPGTAPLLYEVLARGGIGFSLFGIDNPPSDTQTATITAHARNYRLLGPINNLLARAMADGRLKAAIETAGASRRTLDFGDWRVRLAFGPPPWGSSPAIIPNSPDIDGRAFVIRLDADHFLVSGVDVRASFERTAEDGRRGQLLRVEEGVYRDGRWQAHRWLNGDEVDYGINFHKDARLVRVKVGAF
ncbi:DUF5597 domain-containing protein [Stakelama saccharophila]|uniref:DUF5597 domain-containing protein n=1 Tax=Stakelama saccharophila TaxID=3075605 RepID=A0ABZ0B8I2_9SPHN|nr:DUF5597 domain-containing protein [Stakelama sp. W311]WNO53416.1 DUF5597 domain-containing protein [Stakelama sp. W311]